jgi:predicted nucleic-acid-binding Zn-ribbon protein
MNKIHKCPNCGKDDWDIGGIIPRGSNWRIKYRSDSKSVFAIKDEVEARSCNKCGYIELYRLSVNQSIRKAYDKKEEQN